MRLLFHLLCAAIAGLLPAAAMAAACAPPPNTGDGWPVAAPAVVGLDPDRLCALVPWVAGSRQADLHAVLVVRHGKLVFEQYFTGADERWGAPLGEVAHSREQLHDARSVTKSVVALVLGVALDHGLVKGGVDTPVFDLLPQYADLLTAEKAKITLRQLLTMSAGLAWDENIPYGDSGNSETQVDRAPDPAGYVLSQPVAAPPGQVYNYSGGCTALIQAILKRATGQPLDALAHDLLFAPLGIKDVDWVRYPATGEPVAASGLRLLPRDFATLGQLVLQHGLWQSKQIVPAAFVAQRRGRLGRPAHLRRPGARSRHCRQRWPLPQPAASLGAVDGAEPLRPGCGALRLRLSHTICRTHQPDKQTGR